MLVSIVAADALVLEHQAIIMLNTDLTLIVPLQFDNKVTAEVN